MALYEELGGVGLPQFNYLHQDGEKVAQLFETVAMRLSVGSVSTVA